MKLITLTQHDTRASRDALASQLGDEFGEDDAIEGRAEAPTRQVIVNADLIRSMTDRRGGSGSRLTFADGGGFSVVESVDYIKSAMNPI